jgi:hypothetical protein
MIGEYFQKSSRLSSQPISSKRERRWGNALAVLVMTAVLAGWANAALAY